MLQLPNSFDATLKDPKYFKAFLRLAAAYYDLPSHLLWYCDEKNLKSTLLCLPEGSTAETPVPNTFTKGYVVYRTSHDSSTDNLNSSSSSSSMTSLTQTNIQLFYYYQVTENLAKYSKFCLQAFFTGEYSTLKKEQLFCLPDQKIAFNEFFNALLVNNTNSKTPQELSPDQVEQITSFTGHTHFHPFSKSDSFSGSNRHFDRTSNIAWCLLNLTDDAIKTELLQRIFNKEDSHKKFSLYAIFNEVKERLSGGGMLRLISNPPGINLSKYPNTTCAIAVTDTMATGGLLAAGVVGAALLYGMVDSRAKWAKYYQNTLECAHTENNNKSSTMTTSSSAVNSENPSTYQYWVFNSNKQLGKTITEVMASLGGEAPAPIQSATMSQNVSAILSAISSNSDVDLNNIFQLLNMNLQTAWHQDHGHSVDRVEDKGPRFLRLRNYASTLIDLIVKNSESKPELLTDFLSLINRFPPIEQLKLLILCVKANPSLYNTSHTAGVFNKINDILTTVSLSEAVFLILTDQNSDTALSLKKMDEWIQSQGSTEFKRAILMNILTTPSDNVLTWLEKQSDSKKMLKRWMASCIAYGSDIPQTIRARTATIELPFEVKKVSSTEEETSNVTLTLDEIYTITSGLNASGVLLELSSIDAEELYAKAKERNKNKEAVIAYIKTYPTDLQMRCLLDITNGNTLLGRFFDQPRMAIRPLKNEGSRKEVASDLAIVEKLCVSHFRSEYENAINPQINAILTQSWTNLAKSIRQSMFGGSTNSALDSSNENDDDLHKNMTHFQIGEPL